MCLCNPNDESHWFCEGCWELLEIEVIEWRRPSDEQLDQDGLELPGEGSEDDYLSEAVDDRVPGSRANGHYHQEVHGGTEGS